MTKRGLTWMASSRNVPSPVASKLWGIPGGTIATSPARTTRSWPPAVNSAWPSLHDVHLDVVVQVERRALARRGGGEDQRDADVPVGGSLELV